MNKGLVEGVVTRGFYGERRIAVMTDAGLRDCSLDAIVNLALVVGDIQIEKGDRLRVTVEKVAE